MTWSRAARRLSSSIGSHVLLNAWAWPLIGEVGLHRKTRIMTRMNIAWASTGTLNKRGRLGSSLISSQGRFPTKGDIVRSGCSSSSSTRNCILQSKFRLWVSASWPWIGMRSKYHSIKTPFFSWENVLHFGHIALVSLLLLKIMLISTRRPGRPNESHDRSLGKSTRVSASSIVYSQFWTFLVPGRLHSARLRKWLRIVSSNI